MTVAAALPAAAEAPACVPPAGRQTGPPAERLLQGHITRDHSAVFDTEAAVHTGTGIVMHVTTRRTGV